MTEFSRNLIDKAEFEIKNDGNSSRRILNEDIKSSASFVEP